ncbi:VOC family protein [Variovorax sp. UMC13]|uniref:VOC family protein n=1 Tax=Variovorax sp. UMC13 TaxID=1862326 RepID=UPI0016013ECD|nr:VOC family protein [Variovorax sp. UMC13]MBB1601134.1 hypothetical protein [Variovorax sp. UMC13]
MSSFNAYLFFDGTAAQAMPFYKKVLGGKLEVMTYAQMPGAEADKLSATSAARVMHACLSFDHGVLMASDDMEGKPYDPMKGFSLTLNYDEVPEAERVFNALAEGGTVTMPLAKTFWAERFGMFTDRFGTPWMVNAGMSKPA